MTVTIVDAARPVTGGVDARLDLNVASCLVTGGVDTHLDVNVAAALDRVGGLLGVAEFPTTLAGHRDLLGWLSGFGPVGRGGGHRVLRGGAGPVPAGRRRGRGSRWTAPTGRPAAAAGSPTRWMRSRRPGQRCRAGRAGRRSPGMGPWRRSGRWWWPSGPPARRRSRPSTRSAT